MMINWFNDVRSFFERRPNNKNYRSKIVKSEEIGIVKERIKFFDERSQINTKSTGAAIDDRGGTYHFRRRTSSVDVDQNYFRKSNLERTPSMVMNSDNICIYQSMDTIYGSFKIREKSVNQAFYEDNDVIMRLKVREIEHLGVHRYESRLKAPLSQQVVMAKYREDITSSDSCSDPECEYKVVSLIDSWNQECLSNKEKESIIDMALINSIRKKMSISTPSNEPVKILELLGDNQSVKWRDTDKVKSMNLTDTLSRDELHYQEAQFELIITEASYYRSLNVLIDTFYSSSLLSLQTLNSNDSRKFQIKPHQKEHLFSNILKIHSISGKFLSELEKRFEESVIMKDICDIVTKYAENHFNVYIPYIQNQKFQTEAYNELKKDEEATKVIDYLESRPECCSLSLDSYLQLPMQRLMRIMLLLKAIKNNIPKDSSNSSASVDSAIEAIDNVISLCCTKKGLMDERRRMLEISSCLTFKPGQQVISISSGTLLYDGEVKCQRRSSNPKNLRSTCRKSVFFSLLILTNQYLIITKIVRSRYLSYIVEDWCSLSEVVVDDISTEAINKKKNSREFTVNFRNTNRYLIQTKTSDHYDQWIKELTECLLGGRSIDESPC